MACSSVRLLPLLLIAAAPDPGPAPMLRALAAADLRVATVAFRLQTAGRPHCEQATRLPGIVVQDASQYRADLRPVVARLFGLRDLPVVTGVVPGGPAARVGVRAGDAIVAIDGSPTADPAPAPSPGADGARYTVLTGRLDAAFVRGPVTLTLRRGARTWRIAIAGAPACASLVQLGLEGDRNAGADGRTVTVSRGLVDFVASDDELAFVIGHELAHNILRQPLELLPGDDPGAAARRERAADALGLHLAGWAGYDVDAAVRFWRRTAASGDVAALFPDASHPGSGERIVALEREARAIRAAGPASPARYEAFAGRR